jgi:hypothetical protein
VAFPCFPSTDDTNSFALGLLSGKERFLSSGYLSSRDARKRSFTWYQHGGAQELAVVLIISIHPRATETGATTALLHSTGRPLVWYGFLSFSFARKQGQPHRTGPRYWGHARTLRQTGRRGPFEPSTKIGLPMFRSPTPPPLIASGGNVTRLRKSKSSQPHPLRKKTRVG